MGSASASGGSVLDPAGTGSVRHGGSFWQLLTEATPVAPLSPATKTLPGKPNTGLQNRRDKDKLEWVQGSLTMVRAGAAALRGGAVGARRT